MSKGVTQKEMPVRIPQTRTPKFTRESLTGFKRQISSTSVCRMRPGPRHSKGDVEKGHGFVRKLAYQHAPSSSSASAATRSFTAEICRGASLEVSRCVASVDVVWVDVGHGLILWTG
jgi:hypothetical protein